MKVLLLILIPFVLFAQPAPTSIDADSVEHGVNYTISGTAFGTKSPAAPLWWDDCEGAAHANRTLRSGELSWVTSTLTGNSKHYNDVWPTLLSGVYDTLNMMYRHAVRSVTQPHANSTRYLAGGHGEQGECLGGEVGQNVAINVSDQIVSNDWYISYYLRLDPLWPTGSYEHNYKFFVWERTAPYNIYCGSGFLYDNFPGCGSTPVNPANRSSYRRSPGCNANWVAGTIYWEFDAATTSSIVYPLYGYPWITFDTTAQNPLKAWTKAEHMARFGLNHAGSIDKYLHDNVALLDISLDVTDAAMIEGHDQVGGITIGGFYRIQLCSGQDDLDDDAWRYFDDIYIDRTFSRVILGNAATYATCTILEPQIPSAWSATSITVEGNLGALTADSAWVYVFNSDNTSNTNGLLVSLGAVITPPEPPVGVTVTDSIKLNAVDAK